MKFRAYIIIAIGLLAAFAVGRYSATPVNKTVEVVSTEQVDKHVNTKVVQTVDKLPTGEIKTTTTTERVADTQVVKKQDNKEAINYKKPVTNISLIVAKDMDSLTMPPKYGISVSREILGPLTLGVFILTDKTVGLSLGVNF